MKKIITTIISLLTIVSCGEKEQKVVNNDETINIGITQIVDHPALNRARDGFVDVLKESGLNVKIEEQNANGDMTTANLIANNFITSKKDLIYAIATPTAQAVARNTKDIPIVFSAVTDPVETGLVADNITGVSDRVNVEEQMDLLLKLDKNIKTVGFIYNSSEQNSVIQLNDFKKAANKFNVSVVDKAVTQISEVPQSIESLLLQVDAVYFPTDNLIASVLPLLAEKTINKKKISFGSEAAHVEAGALITKGIDYYKLGRKAGEQAVEILNGKAVKDIPVANMELTDIQINENTMKALNLNINIENLK